MRIVLVEYSWQVTEILSKKYDYKKNVIVSLDPESSYILKKNKIPYFETDHFCKHENLWSKYHEITETTFKITKILDNALWKVDERYKNLKWNFFDDHHYLLKISFDCLYYYAELISELIRIYSPQEILIADSKTIDIDEFFLISINCSIIKYLLKNFEDKIKINYMSAFDQKQNKQLYKFSFGQPRYLLSYNNIIKKIKRIYYKTIFYIDYFFQNTKYLSIGCYEIVALKKLYPNETKDYLSYYHGDLQNIKVKNNQKFFEKFKNFLDNDSQYSQLISHKSINFAPIFNEILKKISNNLDFYVLDYIRAKKIVKKKKPKCLIFQSMSPHYSPNVTFRKICKDFKIPYVTWMHGGYCTNSLPGFDVVDYRLCKNHISYGKYLGDLIKSDQSVLKRLNLQENQKIFPIGSLRFDYDNRNKKIKYGKKINQKPTIVFMLGSFTKKNHFYQGYNRQKVESSLWYLHYEILLLLKEYQNRYNIIFKDYPHGHSNMWKKILKDINADKIVYISTGETVNSLLRISDLNILPWISTTFFEALYFEADVFVLDEDLFDEPFNNKLNKEIFWFKNAEKFKSSLKKYLEDGKFYQCTKQESRKYFLNSDAFNNRADLLNTTLPRIT